MTNMINSLPRFGLEEENGVQRIFDYATGIYHTIKDVETTIDSTDGSWNAAAIAEAIKTQQSVFGAYVSERNSVADPDLVDELEEGRAARLSQARVREHDETQEQRELRADKVEQAKQDFLADGAGDKLPAETEEQRVSREESERQLAEQAEQNRLAVEAAEKAERDRLAAEQQAQSQQQNQEGAPPAQ